MARFVLQPCKLRAGWIVPLKNTDTVTLGWDELKTRLAPSGEYKARSALRAMQPGGFVGLLKSRGDRITNFVFVNIDRSGNVGWWMKSDPTLEDRLVEVFRVEEVVWDDSMAELGYTKKGVASVR